jgi:molybdate transport system substrate-binding protein
MRRRTAVRILALATAAATALTGCGSSGSTAGTGGGARPSSGTSAGRTSGTITVFAAASLKESFTALGRRFESEHPGTRVVFSFGPSSGLATQITQGAPADVFASASASTMAQVVDAAAASSPRVFAKNVMEIAVPVENPGHVAGLSDLARRDVQVALCQAAVPCGATAQKVLDAAHLAVRPVTQEVDVKAVLSKVTLGEVDAGVVYVTDVRAAGDKVKGIRIPDAVNAATAYPIATLSSSRNQATARAFADLVLSPEGARALTAAGFARP